MPQLSLNINHSRLYLGAMIEYFQLWKEARDRIKNLSIHVLNIQEKFDDFEELVPVMGKGTVTAMGANSKPDPMPDDMSSPLSVNITAEKVLTLYDTAVSLGFEFNQASMVTVPATEDAEETEERSETGKFYKPVVNKNHSKYGGQMSEALELWNSIADLYFQITDNIYKINSMRGSFGTLQPLDDFGTMVRTPGQIALNFPTAATFMLENDHPCFHRDRMLTMIEDEYFYWLNRSKLDIVTLDPPTFKVVANILKDPEFIEIPNPDAQYGDPRKIFKYIFHAPSEEDAIIGADFCRYKQYGEMLAPIAQPTDEPRFETLVNGELYYPPESPSTVEILIRPTPAWEEWDQTVPEPEPDPNAGKVEEHEASKLSEFMVIVEVLQKG